MVNSYDMLGFFVELTLSGSFDTIRGNQSRKKRRRSRLLTMLGNRIRQVRRPGEFTTLKRLPLFFLDLRPGVSERHGAVEHQLLLG